MKCEQFLGTILDVAAGFKSAPIALEGHLRTCSSCSAKFHDLQKTMDLLDEWKWPEPSSGFDSKLWALLVGARTSAKRSWWRLSPWPVLAIGLATLVLAGILTMRYTRGSPEVSSQQSELEMANGSALEDLQTLEEVESMSGDSDLLDELANEQQNASIQH
jgi:anti-sigma factor RsiW